jgi:predicted AAA+ superfamily ATPase
MHMKRKAMAALVKWKDKSDKQPLVIHGARQVGKTYILKEFGEKYYRNVIYVNMETNQRFHYR